MGLSIDRENVIRVIDELIFEAQKAPTWKAENALRCLKKELLKEQESEAKWIYTEDGTGVDGWYCSECNFFEPWFYEFTEDIDFIRFYGHCPSCGRKMTSYTGKPTQSGR